MTYATRGECQYSPHALRPYGIRGASLRKCVVKRGVISLCGHVRSVHYNANGTNTFVYRAGIPSRRDNAITKVTVVTLPLSSVDNEKSGWADWGSGVAYNLPATTLHAPRRRSLLYSWTWTWPLAASRIRLAYAHGRKIIRIYQNLSRFRAASATKKILTVSTFLEHDTECILNYTMLISFVYIVANVFWWFKDNILAVLIDRCFIISFFFYDAWKQNAWFSWSK